MTGVLSKPDGLIGVLSGDMNPLTGSLSEPEQLVGSLSLPTIISPDAYDGAYEVTPTDSVQTLETADLMMLINVTIGAIPAGWGRIEYTGGFLRIS